MCEKCGKASTCKCYRCKGQFCDADSRKCQHCNEYFCLDHTEWCHKCGYRFCERHVYSCDECRKAFCKDDSYRCSGCKKDFCRRCNHNCSNSKKRPGSSLEKAVDAHKKAKTHLLKEEKNSINLCSSEPPENESGDKKTYRFKNCFSCYRCRQVGEESACAQRTIEEFGETKRSNELVKKLYSIVKDFQSQENGCQAFMLGILITDQGKVYAARSGEREFVNVPGLNEAINKEGFIIVEENTNSYVKNAGGCTFNLFYDENGDECKSKDIGRCAAQRLIRRAIANSEIPIALSEMWYEPVKQVNDVGREKYPDRIDGQRYGPCDICKTVIPQMLCSLNQDEIDCLFGGSE